MDKGVRNIENINNINKINNFLLNSNCTDFRIKCFDGGQLYIVGSFDLSYYHEIEIVFYDVFEIVMETFVQIGFSKSSQPPFQCDVTDDNMAKIIITDDADKKHFIICERVDGTIGTVKYYK